MRVCAPCVCSTCWGQKRTLDPLGAELTDSCKLPVEPNPGLPEEQPVLFVNQCSTLQSLNTVSKDKSHIVSGTTAHRFYPVFICFEIRSHSSPGWPVICPVDQDGLELRDPPATSPQILESKVYTNHTQHTQVLKADSWASKVIQWVKVLVFKTNNNTATNSTLKTRDKHKTQLCSPLYTHLQIGQ